MKSVSSRKASGKLLKYLPGILSLNQFALVGTIMPTLLLVVLVGEICQNDLNFSLETYRSWWKKERICKCEFDLNSSFFQIFAEQEQLKSLPPNTQTSWYPLVTCWGFFAPFKWQKTGPQSAKNQKEDASCAREEFPPESGVFQVMQLPLMWSCGGFDFAKLLQNRAGCFFRSWRNLGDEYEYDKYDKFDEILKYIRLWWHSWWTCFSYDFQDF